MVRGIIEMITVGLCWTSFGVVMGFAPKKKVDVGILLFFSSLAAMAVCGTMGLLSGFPQNVPAVPYGTQKKRGQNSVYLLLRSSTTLHQICE